MEQEKIGPKIKKLRKERSLTQEQLAEALGYSHKSVITHIEKGDMDMTYEKMLILIRRFALDANELFEVSDIEENVKRTKMELRKNRKVAVYIHGLHGSSEEIRDYAFLSQQYVLVGLDYQDGNPWELEQRIKDEFKEITDGCKEIIVIANSIGAFYAYRYLSEFDIKKAFFISPIADMNQIIINMMMDNGVTFEEFKKKKIIHLDNGQTLSYDFAQFVNKKDNWKVPTEILYGGRDDIVYIENIQTFLEDHPYASLTIKKDAEHYFHTNEDKKFIKKWIMREL